MALADDKRKRPVRNPPSTAGRERGGWLAKIAPGVRKLVSRRETPENLWVKCPDTGEMIYRPDLEAALWVTPAGRHMRISPALRFAYTFDGGKFRALPTPRTKDDPLNFTYGKPYREALAAARKNTGDHEAMTAAVGEISGVTSVVAVQNFGFVTGSVSAAVGEAFSPLLARRSNATRHSCCSLPALACACKKGRSRSCRWRAPRSPFSSYAPSDCPTLCC